MLDLEDTKIINAQIASVFSIAVVTLQGIRKIGLLPEVAKTYRAFYEALIAEGFTPDQAMTLVPTYELGGKK